MACWGLRGPPFPIRALLGESDDGGSVGDVLEREVREGSSESEIDGVGGYGREEEEEEVDERDGEGVANDRKEEVEDANHCAHKRECV